MQPFVTELMEACAGVLSAIIHRLVEHRGIKKVTIGCVHCIYWSSPLSCFQ